MVFESIIARLSTEREYTFKQSGRPYERQGCCCDQPKADLPVLISDFENGTLLLRQECKDYDEFLSCCELAFII